MTFLPDDDVAVRVEIDRYGRLMRGHHAIVVVPTEFVGVILYRRRFKCRRLRLVFSVTASVTFMVGLPAGIGTEFLPGAAATSARFEWFLVMLAQR